MKKILSLLLIGGGLFMSSCSKDFNCTCTIVTTDSSGAVLNTATSAFVVNDTEKKAKEACEGGNSTINNGGFTQTSSCQLSAR